MVGMGIGQMAQQFKNTCCSHIGPRSNFQQKHGGSKPSVTSVQGDPTTSSGIYRHQACM